MDPEIEREEAGVTEGCFKVDEGHALTRWAYPPQPTTQEGFCKKLEAKFSIVSDEMEDLEETLKQFKKMFPCDAKLPDYIEKYAQLFKNVKNLDDKVDQEDDDDSGGENGIDDGSQDDASDDEEADDEEEKSGKEEKAKEDSEEDDGKEDSEEDDGEEDSEEDDGEDDSEEDDSEEDSEEDDGGEEENKDEEVHSSFYDLHMTNTNMSTQSSVVYKEIQETLREFFFGISRSCWPILERNYELKFKRSLDYKSLGMSNIKELLDAMGDMVVSYENREKKEKYVMSTPVAKFRREVYLKPDVQKLLKRRCGEIMFDSFEDFYKDQFMSEVNYPYYGLTDLEHLCQIFKDTLVVEEANSSGEKVIKRRLQFKKKEEMNEKIESCWTFEEDDNILLSLFG